MEGGGVELAEELDTLGTFTLKGDSFCYYWWIYISV